MKDKIRLGVIGAGSVVREIYQHLFFHSRYSAILEIAGVADPDPVCRDWFGNLAGLPASRRFTRHRDLIAAGGLDAVQVNTPDHLHAQPALDALAAGLDVVVPKPTAATLKDAHAMVAAARAAGRFLGVDFHKRDDPRVVEAAARYQSGRYGAFQAGVFYMLDKLLVADPNHEPRFFASPDFAANNSPISFLTVHLADLLLQIVPLTPTAVRAIGHRHKLPSLRPIPVEGYDVVDTEITFDTGATAHLLTGWAIPNTAWATTVQSGRLICSEGLIDLELDRPGLRETHADGFAEINPLFRQFGHDGLVSGYGISNPGCLYEQVLARHQGRLSAEDLERALAPRALGLPTTLVLEAAERSLALATRTRAGSSLGGSVDLQELAAKELGTEVAGRYGFA